MSRADHRGPGPFVTHVVRLHRAGGHEVASSRRHRKGLRPHRVRDHPEADRPKPTVARAFTHVWAPTRLPWWIAVSFMVGASCFALGGAASAWPSVRPAFLESGLRLGGLFFLGSIFFTTAAWLQWLEALNGDVTAAFAPKKPWRWFGWLPHNLGYLASLVQLVGTLLFNVNTFDAAVPGLTWQQEDLLVWTPNMIGCVCFLAASVLALVEVMQGLVAWAPRSVSWWIAVVNLAGSVAFQLSAFFAIAGPGPAVAADEFWANAWTLVGAVCFFVAAYLMIPEMFDQEEAGS